MFKRPTIFDLVDYTGVSRGTISRAFNNQPGINARTREKVLKAAKEIGYIPHNGARMMKLGRTSRWGFLVPHLHNPYYAELVEELNIETQENGITLLVGISNNNKQRESEMILQWTAGETDGGPDSQPGKTAAAAGGPVRLPPPGILELEELLSNHLNTRVKVDLSAKRGKVVVEFATLEDLERIYKLMVGTSEASIA